VLQNTYQNIDGGRVITVNNTTRSF